MALPVSFDVDLSVGPQNSYHPPVESSAGNYYTVLLGDPANASRTARLSLQKATDPTSSFSESAGRDISTTNTDPTGSVWCYQKGGEANNTLDVAIQLGTTGDDPFSVKHTAIDLSSDTTIPALTTVDTTPAGDDGPNAVACSVSREETGTDIVVAYQGEADKAMGTEYARIDSNRWSGSAWDGPIQIDNGSTGGNKHWTGPVIVQGSSDRMHIFFKDYTNLDAYQRTLRSDDSLETFPSSFDATTDGSAYLFGVGLSGSTVYCPYGDTGNSGSVVSFTSADTPSPSTTTGVADNAVQAVNSSILHGLAVDGTDLHYLYADQTTSDLYRDENTGSGWGTDTEVLDAVTINHVSPNVYDRSGTKLAYIYDDGGTVKYNEVDLGGSTTITTSADSLLKKQNVLLTTSANALLQKQGLTSTFSADAILVRTLELTLSIGALLKKEGVQLTASGDALLQKQGIELTSQADALLVKTFELTTSADALLQKTSTLTAQADALLKAEGQTVTALADALLQKNDIALTTSVDAILSRLVVLTALADALLQKQGITATASGDALLRKTGILLTVSADAILTVTGSTTITTSADALLQALVSLTVSVDALLRKANIEVTTSADAMLQKAFSLTTSADALLLLSQNLSFSIDALLQKQNITITTQVDAIINAAAVAAAVRQPIGFIADVGRMMGI